MKVELDVHAELPCSAQACTAVMAIKCVYRLVKTPGGQKCGKHFTLHREYFAVPCKYFPHHLFNAFHVHTDTYQASHIQTLLHV